MRSRGVDPDADIEDVEHHRQQQIILKLIERSGIDNRSGEEKTWKDWALGIMAAMVTVGIPAMIYKLEIITTSIATLSANQMADHEEVSRIRARVDRINP